MRRFKYSLLTWCNGVIEYLDNAGVEHEEREVTVNPKYMTEMKEKSGQDKALTLDLDGQVLADSDKEAVKISKG